MVFACAGCRFSVNGATGGGVGGGGGGGGSPEGDLGAGGEVDFAGVALDLSGAGDLTLDPCGNAPPLGAGNLAAQCTIGDPPTLDGDLADWVIGDFRPLTRANAARADGEWYPSEATNDLDLSARFFIKWDETYLYIAASITDDIRQAPYGPPDLQHNDALEIYLDGKHDRTRAYGDDDWQLVFSVNKLREAFRGEGSRTFPSGVVHGVGGTSPRWTFEAGIPWTALGGMGEIGRVVGFDLRLDDNDGDLLRSRDLTLFYNASGLALPPCREPSCRTDAFGAVQLQGR